MLVRTICVYCNEIKFVKLWKETEELVCQDCRESLLEQEFEDEEIEDDFAETNYDHTMSDYLNDLETA
jgi:hypothetical protein